LCIYALFLVATQKDEPNYAKNTGLQGDIMKKTQWFVLLVLWIFLLLCSTVRADEWEINTVDSGEVGGYSSPNLDSNDNPHISSIGRNIL
jgi:hypothetical protein